MALDLAQAYALLLARRDRAGLQQPEALEAYYKSALAAAQQELQSTGISLSDTLSDVLLLVDVASWNLSNREKTGKMPEWLRLKRRERWLQERRAEI